MKTAHQSVILARAEGLQQRGRESREARSTNRRVPQAVVAAVIVAAFAAIGVVSFVVEEAPTPKSFAVVILDVSASSNRDSLCADLKNILKIFFAKPGEREISILATGDRSSGYQPTRVGSFMLESSLRVLEGASAAEDEEKNILGEAGVLCEALPKRKDSPLFAALDAGIRSFVDIGCGENNRACEIWIRTDGIEEQDDTLKRAYRKAGSRQPRLKNENIQVNICGLSERQTATRQALPTLEEIDAAFRSEFTAPELVAIKPACAAFQGAGGRR